MQSRGGYERWTGMLAGLPAGVRLMLTAFLAMIGFGYVVAVANIYTRHAAADGKEGLSIDDIRAVYSGLAVEASGEVPSRMLTMIRTQMREYFSNDGDFAILENWLKAGAAEAGFDEGAVRRTPRRIIIRDCLRCHAQSTKTDISRESPFGPDDLTTDYEMIAPFVTVAVDASARMVQAPPQYQLPRLILVSHQHMLTIPVFTLIVAAMFTAARIPPALRGLATPAPMLALIVDFGGWWLSRAWDGGVYLVAGAGAVYGVTFAAQLAVVTVDLWRGGSNRGGNEDGRHDGRNVRRAGL